MLLKLSYQNIITQSYSFDYYLFTKQITEIAVTNKLYYKILFFNLTNCCFASGVQPIFLKCLFYVFHFPNTPVTPLFVT